MTVTVLRLEPDTKPTSLVVLVHGYGADGADLLDLGVHWRSLLPNAAFIAPNAPSPCEMNPMGYQWWSLADGMELAGNLTRCQQVAPVLQNILVAETARYGLGYDRVALVGFSQGTMLSLHVGLTLPHKLACIVGYSGMMLDENPGHITQPCPTLLVHGMMDPIVPFFALDRAAHTLQAAGVPVETMVRPLLAHGIDPDGLAAGGAFLAGHLPQQATA